MWGKILKISGLPGDQVHTKHLLLSLISSHTSWSLVWDLILSVSELSLFSCPELVVLCEVRGDHTIYSSVGQRLENRYNTRRMKTTNKLHLHCPSTIQHTTNWDLLRLDKMLLSIQPHIDSLKKWVSFDLRFSTVKETVLYILHFTPREFFFSGLKDWDVIITVCLVDRV